jgi:D-3-phosphoglycerate dehydrogenase
VLAYDPYVDFDVMEKKEVEPVDLEHLLKRSDFVSLHARVSRETIHILGEEEFQSMKPTAYLVNTSRGIMVDEKALIRALKEGWIAGAGLDVLDQEPPARENPLLSMDNVLVTGHAAGTTEESSIDWQEEWRKIIDEFIKGYWPINVVNPEVEPKMYLKKP